MNMEHYRYLIIGNSTGGIGTVEGIRAVDPEGPIAVIGEEPGPAYARPLISELLSGEKTQEQIFYRPSRFYPDNRVDLFAGTRAEEIDISGRLVRTEDGKTRGWEKLLLAVGGTPIVPEFEGRENPGVFTFTTREDALQIREYLRKRGGGKRVVILGGGLIGLKAAEAFRARGLEVVMVELQDRVLAPVLDPASSRWLENVLSREGISLRFRETVVGVRSARTGGFPLSVELKSGDSIPADLLLVAIGVRPRVELAQASGLQVDRGIMVNQKMETSTAGIFSCGDVASIGDFFTGTNRPIPVWINAYWGGRVAGMNMAGEDREFEMGMMMNALRVFGQPVISAGLVNPPAGGGVEVLQGEEKGSRRALLVRDGRLLGFSILGEIQSAGILAALIRSRAEIGEFRPRLLKPDFSLLDLPRGFRQELREGRWNRSEKSTLV